MSASSRGPGSGRSEHVRSRSARVRQQRQRRHELSPTKKQPARSREGTRARECTDAPSSSRIDWRIVRAWTLGSKGIHPNQAPMEPPELDRIGTDWSCHTADACDTCHGMTIGASLMLVFLAEPVRYAETVLGAFLSAPPRSPTACALDCQASLYLSTIVGSTEH